MNRGALFQSSLLVRGVLAVLALTSASGCYQGLDSGAPGGDPQADGSGPGADDAGGDDGSGSDGEDDDTPIPEEPAVPTGWSRLTHSAFENTVSDLLAYASDPATGEAAFADLEGVLGQLPADGDIDYATADQSMSQAHVDAYFEVGMRIGEVMTQSDERLTAFVGNCATQPGDQTACLDDFVERFGLLVHRSPLTDGEIAFYRADAYTAGNAIDVDALADLIAVMTTSAKFLYRVELGAEAFDGEDTMVVGDYELASRISYLLWHSMPDPELLAAAADGALGTADGRAAAVDRLFANPRAQVAFATFFTHWLELEEHPNLAGALSNPAYAALAGNNAPSPELAEDMAAEVVDSVVYHVWTAQDDITGWFASPYAFPRTAELAAIYGVEAWDGQADPPTAPASRAGLLTRPAFLAATSMRSRPILRGALVRKQVLCDTLPPPPPDAQGAAGLPGPTDGARAWTENVTSADGCVTCHASINPLGFVLEGFDPLGRERTDELLFDEDGTLLATLPVDTTASARVAGLDGDVSGPHEVVDMILESGGVGACLASEYFRYAFGRDVDPDSADAALLERLESSLSERETMADFLKALALHPTFRVRGWEAP